MRETPPSKKKKLQHCSIFLSLVFTSSSIDRARLNHKLTISLFFPAIISAGCDEKGKFFRDSTSRRRKSPIILRCGVAFPRSTDNHRHSDAFSSGKKERKRLNLRLEENSRREIKCPSQMSRHFECQLHVCLRAVIYKVIVAFTAKQMP